MNMRFLMLASLALVAVASPPSNKAMLFKSFMEKYHPHYATELEKEQRFQIFSENVDLIDASNAKNRTFTLGITNNADRTFQEWRGLYLTGLKHPLSAPKNHNLFAKPEGFAEPDSVDWVAKGGVTEVKSQGTCGSCWTFSTVGALEGAMFVAGRGLVELSMQHILACDQAANGCKGGVMDQAFDWVAQNGVTALKDEPYICQDGSSSQCTSMSCPDPEEGPAMAIPVGGVTKHTDVDKTEGALEAAVAQQPVSVAIEADQTVFQHYTGGVLTNDACGSQTDHGVLAVGYGVDNGQQYWKVKNSWGPTWGEQGYVRIEKGSPSEVGECGIRESASFPTVKAKGVSDGAIVV